MVDYALKIKELRKFLSLTQEQFSVDTGISRSRISQIEIGKFKPTIKSLTDIARIYSIDVNYFFNEEFLLSIGTSKPSKEIVECSLCKEKERLIRSLENQIENQNKMIEMQDRLLKIKDPTYKQSASG
ncbi:MAG: helix-turn-helix transcriptional regulator [Bacteroidota bacterium]